MPKVPKVCSLPVADGGGTIDWVPPFLHHHLLAVGALAWQGHQRSGYGMVCCAVELPRGRPIHWAKEHISHRLWYLPQERVAAILEPLQLDTRVQAHLQRALVTYDATTELVALMLASSEPTIVQLRRMRITPAECHRQVQRRHSEFCGVGR